MDGSPNFGGYPPPGETDPAISTDRDRHSFVQFQPNPSSVDSPPQSEVFQMLANEVRIQIVLELYRKERTERAPIPFSTLQSAVGSDESAGFAYHVRQLVGHFVEKDQRGYTLTPAGRQAANSIIQGTFTNTAGGRHAS